MQITCPSCGHTVDVTGARWDELRCPNCSAQLPNPIRAGGPIPVLPIEREVSRDARSVGIGVVLLWLLMACGALAATRVMNPETAVMAYVLVGVMLVLVMVALRRGPAQTAAHPAPWAWETEMQPGQPPILSYEQRRPKRIGPKSWLAFTGGFFSAIAVCAAGFAILAKTVDVKSVSHSAILMGVGAMVVAFMFFAFTIGSRRSAWRGFGPGATTGLALGMVALGPCAFCYLTTL